MYGRYSAMGGTKLPDLQATSVPLSITRITLSLLLSAMLHLMLLWVPIFGGDIVWFANRESDLSRLEGVIKLDFVHGAMPEISSAQLPLRQVAPSRNQTGRPSSRMGRGGLSASKPDRNPILLSEIDVAVESWGIKGKMILHLEVDASGEVRFLEVIYSELPDAVGQDLRRRFEEARFQPAVRNGRVVEASVMLLVNVD